MNNKRIELLDILMDELPEDTPWRGNIKGLLENLLARGVIVQKWIPVSERLPGKEVEVLCYHGNFIGSIMDVYTYKGDNKWEDSYGYWSYGDIEGITHWMPLPEPPKEE